MLPRPEQQQAVESHVKSHFNNSLVELFSWQLGGVKESLPFFRVHRVELEKHRWLYISNGASTITKGGTYGCEFIVEAPYDEPLMVELLAMAAHFQAAPELGFLDVGSVLEIGQPWIEGSSCDHLLVSLPYPFGSKLEWLCIEEQTHVRFVWLLPITKKEAEYARLQGVKALEDLFQEKQLRYLDVRRDSLVDNNNS